MDYRGLYDKHGLRCLAVARRVLGSQSEAEEVVQDVFLDVWRRSHEFDPARGSVAAWIMTMVRHRAIDRLRSRTVAERTLAAAAREPEAATRTPASALQHKQVRRRLHDALEALPDAQRNVIHLAYFEGLSQREIAARTGDPLGTVKWRAREALARLALCVADV